MISAKWRDLSPLLTERTRRLWAASEARALGTGGIACVESATGLSRTTIRAGIAELGRPAVTNAARARREGGGRKPLPEGDATLLSDLEALVDPVTRGDPESPLRWTCKSMRKLSAELVKKGHEVSHVSVGKLLKGLGYSLQANRKTREGTSQHPDRNAQFEYINEKVDDFQARSEPVISVDTKKKELVGNYKNAGTEWMPSGAPEEVLIHDFRDPKVGKAIPYGIYDLDANRGFVNVGMDHDTPEFAVESIRAWWRQMGRRTYPEAEELMITADGGGSNGYRARAWKAELQGLADQTGLRLSVSHFPPGTSKWNKIEHRLFCHITENWRGRPLASHEAVVSLIGSTRTTAGLKVKARLDRGEYPTGVKVPKLEFSRLQIERANFHGEWNYTIAPRAS